MDISTITVKIPEIGGWFINFINLSMGSGKILNILIILVVGYLVFKYVAQPLIKIAIIILVIILALQTGISFL